jgi:probable addiction module antidote protein
MPLKNFKDSPIAEDLRSRKFAAEYLEDALNEDVQDFIIALRNVADANGGLGQLAELAELGRESLYKTLSPNGNSSPYFSTIHQILDALGMKLSIHPKKNKKEAA